MIYSIPVEIMKTSRNESLVTIKEQIGLGDGVKTYLILVITMVLLS